MTAAECRRKLRALGRKRERHKDSERDVADEIREVVSQLESAGVTAKEAAEILGMSRSTFYDVYR